MVDHVHGCYEPKTPSWHIQLICIIDDRQLGEAIKYMYYKPCGVISSVGIHLQFHELVDKVRFAVFYYPVRNALSGIRWYFLFTVENGPFGNKIILRASLIVPIYFNIK